MYYIYDIINLEFVFFIVFLGVAYCWRLEPLKVLLLFGHILVIFLLNDVLFPVTYMPDQLLYLNTTQDVRNFTTGLEKFDTTFGFSSLLFSIVPLPFINSVQSLAMINFLIFLTIFVFIKKVKLSTERVDYFLLLFPSLLLYSSLALRDMFVLLFLFLGLYALIIRERYFFGLLLASPVIILKFQNYLMIVGALILFFYLRKAKPRRYLILGIFVFISAFIPEKVPLVSQLYEKIEWWRFALFADQFYYNWTVVEQMKQYYEPLGTGFILLYQVIKFFFYMLLKPLPWEAGNLFQLVQSVENLIIFVMIIWCNRIKIINDKIRQKIFFLNSLLFVSMTINGLVVFNFGSAVRYKFPFIVIYFVYFFYLLKSDELFVKQVKTIWSVNNKPQSGVLPISSS